LALAREDWTWRRPVTTEPWVEEIGAGKKVVVS
jgi:hypothetical protein